MRQHVQPIAACVAHPGSCLQHNPIAAADKSAAQHDTPWYKRSYYWHSPHSRSASGKISRYVMWQSEREPDVNLGIGV